MIYKEFDESYNFWKVSCDEGEVISDWTEDKDILDYNSFKIAYCPPDSDLDVYHTFTEIEDIELSEKKRIAEEER